MCVTTASSTKHRRYPGGSHGNAVAGGQESIVGLAAVRSVFRSSKFGTVAGCMVIDGYVAELSDSRVAQQRRHLRGRLGIAQALQGRRQRSSPGTECGIGLKNYSDVQENDQIECYSRVEVGVLFEARARRIQRGRGDPTNSARCASVARTSVG